MRVVKKVDDVLVVAIMCIKDTSMLDTAAEKATLMDVPRVLQNWQRGITSVSDIVIVSKLHAYYGEKLAMPKWIFLYIISCDGYFHIPNIPNHPYRIQK